MSLQEFLRHESRVVEICQGGVGVQSSCIEDALGTLLYLRLQLGGGRWPWEVVINDVLAVLQEIASDNTLS